jgi:hypothetical protein
MRTTDVGAREGTKRGLSVPAGRRRAPDVWGAPGWREVVGASRRVAVASTFGGASHTPDAECSCSASNGGRSFTVPSREAEA